MRVHPWLLALAASNVLPAQGSFVTPSLYGAAAGNGFDLYTGYYIFQSATPVHIQFVYDTWDIPVAGALLTGMDLRPAARASNPAAMLTLSVDLSVGPNGSAAATNVFAANSGPAPVRVFQGAIQLPAYNGVAPGPAPWNVPIVFSTPFPYSAAQGSGLVVDARVTSFVPSANNCWLLDAVDPEPTGRRLTNGPPPSNCHFSNGRYNNALQYQKPTVGGTWWVQYTGLLGNAPGIGLLGDLGAGARWNGIPLPLDLGPVGAPGCFLATDPVLAVPLQADSLGQSRWPTVPIPNDVRLGGTAFYEHSLWLDPLANALGLVSGWSSGWVVGDLGPPRGVKLYAMFDTTNNPAGTLVTQAVIARFHY